MTMMRIRKGHVQVSSRKLKVKQTLAWCQQCVEGHWNLLCSLGCRSYRLKSEPNTRRLSFLLASDGMAADLYLKCMHHTVLRLMVQRMEANYGELDQTSNAAQYA